MFVSINGLPATGKSMLLTRLHLRFPGARMVGDLLMFPVAALLTAKVYPRNPGLFLRCQSFFLREVSSMLRRLEEYRDEVLFFEWGIESVIAYSRAMPVVRRGPGWESVRGRLDRQIARLEYPRSSVVLVLSAEPHVLISRRLRRSRTNRFINLSERALGRFQDAYLAEMARFSTTVLIDTTVMSEEDIVSRAAQALGASGLFLRDGDRKRLTT